MRYVIQHGSIFLLLLSLVVLSGCASLVPTTQNYDSPKVALTSVRIVDMTGLELLMEIQLRITNPNAAPMRIQAIQSAVEVNGEELADGISPVKVIIAPFSSTVISVQLQSSLFKSGPATIRLLKQFNAQSTVEVSLDGKIHLEYNAVTDTYTFAEIGTLVE